MSMDPERLYALAEAYEEAGGHLELAWTDDPVEREEGNRLAALFHAKARKLRSKASPDPGD